jgi:hypothetical protein
MRRVVVRHQRLGLTLVGRHQVAGLQHQRVQWHTCTHHGENVVVGDEGLEADAELDDRPCGRYRGGHENGVGDDARAAGGEAVALLNHSIRLK